MAYRMFRLRPIFLFLSLLSSAPAFGQASQAAAIRIGGSELRPSVELEFGQSDNALRQADDEIDEQFVIFKPTLEWSADRGVTRLGASYEGAFKTGDLDETEFADSTVAGEISTEFNKRSRIDANASIEVGHQELGADVFTRIDPLAFDQVEFFRQQLSVRHTFGASQARGQIISRLNIDNLDYTNNDSVTENSSRLLFSPSIAFSFRVSQDTRTFVSLGAQQVDRAANGLDRTSIDADVGASWEISGRTSGSAQIGVSQASLDGGEDTTEVTLQVGFDFEPTSFSRFDFDISRDFFNNGSGSLVEAAVNNRLAVRWRHDYSSRVYHIARLSFQNVERTCPAVGDETADFRLEIGVQVRRWIALGFGGDFETRTNSSCPGLLDETLLAPDYDRVSGFAFLRVSL